MKPTHLLTLLTLLTLTACSYLPTDELTVEAGTDYQETTEYIQLAPATLSSDQALIFVPGGLVDPHAYIPVLEPLTEVGITVILLKVAANLAILESGKPLKVQKDFPDFTSWYIGGHSLGGISALSVVGEEPDAFQGLILLGAYPTEGFSIPDWDGNALSLYAENDGLSTVAEIEENQSFLPTALTLNDLSGIDSLQASGPVTLYHLIEGGNHAQFGDYGPQAGDGAATLSPEAQHTLIVEAITKFIEWNESL